MYDVLLGKLKCLKMKLIFMSATIIPTQIAERIIEITNSDLNSNDIFCINGILF